MCEPPCVKKHVIIHEYDEGITGISEAAAADHLRADVTKRAIWRLRGNKH